MNGDSSALATPAAVGVRRATTRVGVLDRAGPIVGDARLVALALFLLGLGPRLWNLGGRSLWFDELLSLSRAALSFGDLLLALSVQANMTLYYWLLWAWLHVVGVGAGEALVRLPSALFGAAEAPLVYLLGRRLHSPAAGLAAATLLVVNGFDVLLSQQARSYTLFSTLTTLSYLLLDRGLEHGRRRDWVLHGIVTALAFYSQFFAVFSVLAQGLFVLSRRSRAALIGLFGSGLVMAALLAPLVPFFLNLPEGARLSHLYPPDFRAILSFLVGFSGGTLGTLGIYAVLVAIGVGRGGSAGRSRGYRNWMLLAWFCVPVGLAVGVSLVEPIFRPRYLCATLPAVVLLAGIGMARLPRPVAAAAFVTVVGLSLWALRDESRVRAFETLRPMDEWRQAASHTMPRALPGDGWIFISKWGQHGFEYYAGWHWGRNPAAPYGDIFEPFNWRDAAREPDYRGVISMDALEQFVAVHPRIWLVQSHELDRAANVDRAARIRGWLTRRDYRDRVQRFRGVQILLFERRGGA